jgi:hypothetical protein
MNQNEQPTVQQITRRAYQLYLERGGQDGNDVKDWLTAEQELREPVGEVTKAKAATAH